MEKSPLTPASHLDRMAIALSGLCLVHCVIVSLVALSVPALAGILGDGWTHLALLLVVVPLSVVALPRGYRDHAHLEPLWIGCAGLLLLLLGATVGHFVFGPAVDTTLTVAGSLLVALAHLLNAFWCGRPATV